MQNLVLATNNQGKINELQAQLSKYDFHVISQRELNVPDVAETGLTFVENAIIKARHAAALTGLPSIADDSGLAVQALNGEPGIHSARYSGDNANDEKNNEKLLTSLLTVPTNERQAYFYCALVYLQHANDPTPIICQGKWPGYILTSPKGKYGFGYDSLFYIPALNCTAADLPEKEKNAVSHRGQALKLMIKALHRHG